MRFWKKLLFNEKAVFRIASHLENHWWLIGVNKTKYPLYTSDNPVVRRANCKNGDMPLIGILDRGIEFAFPLNSKYLLLILEKQHFAKMRKDDGKCINLMPEQVADYNCLQVLKSFRQVYCEVRDFDLAEQVCETNPESCRPDRDRIKVDVSNIGPMKSQMIVQVLD